MKNLLKNFMKKPMESKDSGKNDISEGKSENVNKGDTATSSEWSSGEASFIHRIYQDLEAYKEHQRSKLG